MSQLRQPSAAGYFYPDGKDKLREQVDWLLRIGYQDKLFDHISGLVAPHAGYIYSGRTAAFAYNTIRKPRRNNPMRFSYCIYQYYFNVLTIVFRMIFTKSIIIYFSSMNGPSFYMHKLIKNNINQ